MAAYLLCHNGKLAKYAKYVFSRVRNRVSVEVPWRLTHAATWDPLLIISSEKTKSSHFKKAEFVPWIWMGIYIENERNSWWLLSMVKIFKNISISGYLDAWTMTHVDSHPFMSVFLRNAVDVILRPVWLFRIFSCAECSGGCPIIKKILSLVFGFQ